MSSDNFEIIDNGSTEESEERSSPGSSSPPYFIPVDSENCPEAKAGKQSPEKSQENGERKETLPMATKVAHASITSDQSHLTISDRDGFKTFQLHPVFFRQKTRLVPDVGPIRICRAIDRSQLVVYTCAKGGKFAQNVVMTFDVEKNDDLIEITTPPQYGPVTNFQVSQNRLAIFTNSRIFIYIFPSKCHQIRSEDIHPNPTGISAMSYDPTTSACFLAYPGFKTGSVQIVNLNTLTERESKAPVVIEAHLTEITQVALNCQGTLVATGSTKGTVIRVFDARTKGMLYELRRGSVQAHLHCLQFSPCSSYLAVASDHGTLHVFGIRDAESQKKKTVIERNLGTSSIARIQLERQVLALGFSKQTPKSIQSLVAVCSDGSYWRYPFSKDNRGNVHHNVGTFENLILLAEEARFFSTPI